MCKMYAYLIDNFRKVYWVDAWKKKLYTAPVHSGDASVAVDLTQYIGQNVAFGVAMVEGTALISVWGTGQVMIQKNFNQITAVC